MRTLVLLAISVLALAFAGAATAAPDIHTNLNEKGDVEIREDAPRFGFGDALDAALPQQSGCTAAFLSRNFSSRNGVRPTEIVLHYTVSSNTAGTGDVRAIRDFFNQDRTNASSHYVIDFEGNCLQLVKESDKAWTQGNANPTSLSIEFIARGDERVWPTAGLSKGAAVVFGMAKRWGIPIRLVDPVGCNFPAGITDHDRLECGNSHTDVKPFFPMTKFIGLVKTAGVEPVNFKVRVDPVGPEKVSTVWKGAKAPTKVSTSRGTSTTKPWRVSVGERVVWRGKLYPQAVTTGRS